MSREDAIAGYLQLEGRRPDYQLHRRYLTGRHPLMFATAAFERFYESVVGKYQLNLTPSVVSAPAERLDIDGWEGPSDRAGQRWDEVGGPALANRVHREKLGMGDAYVMVWPAGGKMDGPDTPWPLRADEATVVYDDETPDTVRFGIKTWKQDDTTRINVLYPDRVERWQTTSKGTAKVGAGVGLEPKDLEPVKDDTGDTVGHRYGRPPIEHFANGAGMDDFGRSELVDVLPPQDALNKHAVDILVASESVGFPLRALLGFAVEEEPVVDSDGQPMVDDHGRVVMQPSNLPDYDPRLDRFLAFGGEHTRLIQLDPGDLKQLVEIKEAAALEIAQVSGIPLHYLKPLSGQIPSGESLRVVERRLTAKVEDRQQSSSPRWSGVMDLLGVPDTRPRWSDPTSMDETEVWDLVKVKVDTGMPLKQALIETGRYRADDIDEFLSEAVRLERTAGQQVVDAFRRGEDPAALL